MKRKSEKNKAQSAHAENCHSNSAAKDFLRRFYLVSVLIVPLLLGTDFAGRFANLSFFQNEFLRFALASAIFYNAFVFFRHAYGELKARSPGMMTLVSVAVLSGYLFSLFASFSSSLEGEFYFEISTLIWVLLFGHYLEARSAHVAEGALGELAKLLPERAHRLEGEREVDVAISDLRVGDKIVIKEGERVPADAVVLSGEGALDESFLSGESRPALKRIGDELLAGSVSLDSSFVARVLRTGERSSIGRIHALVLRARKTKPRFQKVADRASKYLTVITLSVSLLTFLVWTLLAGKPVLFAATLAISVLVAACPHALGLAIPAVSSIGLSLAARSGIFIKDLSKIEVLQKADIVLFDKTGTLTESVLSLGRITKFAKTSEKELLRIAASAELGSSHIIADAVLQKAEELKIKPERPSKFKAFPGKGLQITLDGRTYLVGNEALLKEHAVAVPEQKSEPEGMRVFVASEKEALGVITLESKIKKDAREALQALRALGLRVVMISGDSDSVARQVARELNIKEYFAEVLPEDKYRHVQKLQSEGNVVVMVGDGINDAPALAQADVSLAIGTAVDLARDAGDILLTGKSLMALPRLIVLARNMYKKSVQNLFWAFAYNIVAIPLAAGVFYYQGFNLRPEFAALAMTLSSVVVVANAMLLKKIKLEP